MLQSLDIDTGYKLEALCAVAEQVSGYNGSIPVVAGFSCLSGKNLCLGPRCIQDAFFLANAVAVMGACLLARCLL